MQIFVKTLMGKTITLEVESSDMIDNVIPTMTRSFNRNCRRLLRLFQTRLRLGISQYAKFQLECDNLSGAADYLYQYSTLCSNLERSMSALWGQLASEILMQTWDIALEELNHLKEIIDSKVNLQTLNPSGLVQLQSDQAFHHKVQSCLCFKLYCSGG